LNERYAKGEINKDEYEEIKSAISPEPVNPETESTSTPKHE